MAKKKTGRVRCVHQDDQTGERCAGIDAFVVGDVETEEDEQDLSGEANEEWRPGTRVYHDGSRWWVIDPMSEAVRRQCDGEISDAEWSARFKPLVDVYKTTLPGADKRALCDQIRAALESVYPSAPEAKLDKGWPFSGGEGGLRRDDHGSRTRA